MEKKHKRNNRKKVTSGETTTEIIEDILTRLPVKSFLRFKCVSNAWCNLISSPSFCKLKIRRSSQEFGGKLIFFSEYSNNNSTLYSFDYHNIDGGVTQLHCPIEIIKSKLVGSCNGLLCFKLSNSRLALYNPATRVYKLLPEVGTNYGERYETRIRGEFAYDTISDDYKVIRFAGHYERVHCCGRKLIAEERHIYSLKANSWETIQINPSAGRPSSSGASSRSVVINNSLHWIAHSNKKTRSKVIWRFDLSTLEYQEMPLPPDSFNPDAARLASLKGYLHLIQHNFAIWKMEEYGVVESWTKVFNAIEDPIKTRFRTGGLSLDGRVPCAYSKDGTKILVAEEKNETYFCCCDVENQTASDEEILGVPTVQPGRIVAEPWVESIVPLD